MSEKLSERLDRLAGLTVESPAPHLTGGMKFYVYDAETREAMTEAAAALRAVEGADEALLISMATCLNHGFGLLSPDRQESILNDMRKLLDEVAGRGYYRPENRGFYLSMRRAPLDAAGSAEGVG